MPVLPEQLKAGAGLQTELISATEPFERYTALHVDHHG
jgi:hypothetical protein